MIETSQPTLIQAMLRQDLGTFIAKVFQHLCPGDRYLHNWHIDAIVFQLMAVHGAEFGG